MDSLIDITKQRKVAAAEMPEKKTPIVYHGSNKPGITQLEPQALPVLSGLPAVLRKLKLEPVSAYHYVFDDPDKKKLRAILQSGALIPGNELGVNEEEYAKRPEHLRRESGKVYLTPHKLNIPGAQRIDVPLSSLSKDTEVQLGARKFELAKLPELLAQLPEAEAQRKFDAARERRFKSLLQLVHPGRIPLEKKSKLDFKDTSENALTPEQQEAGLIDITKQRKVAALKPDVELQPHQQRVVSRLEKEPAVLAYHGLGSGKTLASIAAGEQIGGEKTIVVPAALRENYAKELNKFVGKDPTGYNIVSYTKATRPGGMPPAGLTVFDEAHRMGREGTQASKLVAKAPGKVLMLTGTPVRNDPVEFVPLLRALGQGRNPPRTQQAFREKFIERTEVKPGLWDRFWYGAKSGIIERMKNRKQLAALVAGRVDYNPPEGEYPSVTEENIEVEMTPEQTKLYNAFLDEDRGLARKVRRNLPPSKAESLRLNAFLSAVRQLSNNPQSFDVSLAGSPMQHSPKLQRMFDEIQKGIKTDKNFKAVVYSNYLDSGIMPLFNVLQEHGVPAHVFSGGLTDVKRREIVNDYNSGKTKVLLLSGAGSEGLDLKGTKLMQLMEPHWNESRLDQVTGRAIRHKSHSHLPESEREVKVQYFYSRPQPTWLQRHGFGEPDTGADRYMANLSAQKQALINDFLKVLQQSSRESKVASLVDIVKRSADFAPGLPDPRRFGRPADVTTGAELPYVVQRHRAERAGPHYDVRFGVQPSPSAPLLSFATKKEMPGPGGKIMLFQQPLHKGQYASFEGELERGYGKGTVKTHDKGGIIVTKAQSDQVNFMVTHKRFPEFYTLKRIGGPAGKETARQRATQGGTWLLINTTPMDAAKLLGGKPEQVGLNKLKYTSVPADKVEKLFSPDYRVQAKLDGASALYHLLSDRIEALSYRVSKEGRPIIHTYRIFGPGGARLGRSIPKDLEGTILRGEIFGMREGKAIPSQELGGLLNASVANSLRQQQERKVDLRNMVFDVVRLGKNPVGPMGAEERLAKLTEISKYLPKNKFMLPETAQTPEQARELYRRIVSGEHPLTREGIVGWPIEPGKKPIKVKPRPESDVWVRNIFPGEKGLEGVGAGGFEYSLSPEGPIVGRVGTGFTQQTREEMLKDPESWVGRLARISSLEKFPSGAHRAPSFTALHEDYPMKKVGATETGPATLARELGHVTGDQRPLGYGLGAAVTPLAGFGAGLAGLYFSWKP